MLPASGQRDGLDARDPALVCVLGTQRGVGKSVVTGALAMLFRHERVAVGVFKPVSIECRRTREGLVSADVEFLAHCANARHDLATLNPIRYEGGLFPAESARRQSPAGARIPSRTLDSESPLARAIPARRDSRTLDLESLDESLRRVSQGCAYVLIEGVGGLLEPLDAGTTMIELAARWRARTVLVAPSSVGAANHVLMAVECLRRRYEPPIAILLNRYDADSAPLADEINPEQIVAYARAPLPLMVPYDPRTSILKGRVGPDLLAALRPLATRLAADLA